MNFLQLDTVIIPSILSITLPPPVPNLQCLLHSQHSSCSPVSLSWSLPGHIEPVSTTNLQGTPIVDYGPLVPTSSTSPIFYSSHSTHVSSFKFLFILLHFKRSVLIYDSCINFCQNKDFSPQESERSSTHETPFSCVQSPVLPVFYCLTTSEHVSFIQFTVVMAGVTVIPPWPEVDIPS